MFSCIKILFFVMASFGSLCNEIGTFLDQNLCLIVIKDIGMNWSAAALQKCQHQCFSLRHDLMQKAFHGDAAAVAFTHAALWFLGKQMGEMQTVYHDRLQMSFCGQCTLLWKWFGQWKREEKYNMDKKGKWESF